MAIIEETVTAAVETGSRFPPSFADNVFYYWFALTSTSMMALVSFAIVLQNFIGNVHRRKAIAALRAAGVRVFRPAESDQEDGKRTLLCDYFTSIMNGLFTAIFFGVSMDALIMLLWNEVGAETLVAMYQLDRLFDGLVMLPFLYAIFHLAVAEEALTSRLVRNAREYSTLKMFVVHIKDVLERGRLLFLTTILCAGVALYKAIV